MNTKHTKEYAKKLLSDMMGVSSQTEDEMFIMGYMAAIEQTAAPDLLEACKNAITVLRKLSNKDACLGTEIMLEKAIKKATE